MSFPWWFAGRRWVATRALRQLRDSSLASADLDRGWRGEPSAPDVGSGSAQSSDCALKGGYMGPGAAQAGSHRVEREVARPQVAPALVAVHHWADVVQAGAGEPALHADQVGIAADTSRSGADGLPGRSELSRLCTHREPAVGKAADTIQGAVPSARHPHRDGLLDGARTESNAASVAVRTCSVHRTLGPVLAKESDLLLQAASARIEVAAKRLRLDPVPPDADPEPETATGEDVHFGCLLGDQGCLALRKDQNGRAEIKPGDARKEAHEDHDLVERVVQVVGLRRG